LLEDEGIASSPDGPSYQHDQLHEERNIERKFQACNEALNICVLRRNPGWTYVAPTHLSKRTLEEHVVSCFQLILVTHNARIIVHEEVLPLKHGSGIEAIMNQQPEKDLMLLLTATLPHPFQCLDCTTHIHERFINCGSFSNHRIPKDCPGIKSSRRLKIQEHGIKEVKLLQSFFIWLTQLLI
jgi:hypothetical protein